MFETRVKGVLPQFNNRFKETWSRPAEIAPGITLAWLVGSFVLASHEAVWAVCRRIPVPDFKF